MDTYTKPYSAERFLPANPTVASPPRLTAEEPSFTVRRFAALDDDEAEAGRAHVAEANGGDAPVALLRRLGLTDRASWLVSVRRPLIAACDLDQSRKDDPTYYGPSAAQSQFREVWLPLPQAMAELAGNGDAEVERRRMLRRQWEAGQREQAKAAEEERLAEEAAERATREEERRIYEQFDGRLWEQTPPWVKCLAVVSIALEDEGQTKAALAIRKIVTEATLSGTVNHHGPRFPARQWRLKHL